MTRKTAKSASDTGSFMSRKQLAVIHVAKHRLGLDDDTYRAALRQHGAVDSAVDLDSGGFERLMAFFRRAGFRSDFDRKTFGGQRAGMASLAQLSFIGKLWAEWSNGTGDGEAGLNRWLEKHYGVSALRFLTADGAGKAITGLRAMVKRQGK
jgi:hypothetical protein